MKESDLRTRPEKKYIEIQYDPVTQGYLQEFCDQHGFDLSMLPNGKTILPEKFNFHTTVWYTTTEHDLENGSQECFVEATPTRFLLLGENSNTLALKIQSPQLLEIRETFGEVYGMQDEWPSYLPHISLSYNYHGDLPDFDPAQELEMPLIANKLHIKTQ